MRVSLVFILRPICLDALQHPGHFLKSVSAVLPQRATGLINLKFVLFTLIVILPPHPDCSFRVARTTL